ncbi:MAG: peptidylprolyl isomerase [Chthonomonas sp.]|nr:peptidylprolyl isomerase [Chthonomonas sp.]
MTSLALAAVLLAQPSSAKGPQIVMTMKGNKQIVIQTNQGESPKTVEHIVALVKKKFYDGIRFHRVEDWVVQWGDPGTKKALDGPEIGNGGSGKQMKFEGSKFDFKRGAVGIASTGSKVGGDSQIFILTKDSVRLNGMYAVLGWVTKGMDVVDKLKRGDTIVSMRVVIKPAPSKRPMKPAMKSASGR